MNAVIRRFVEVLEEDMRRWEEAAAGRDALVEHVPVPDREGLRVRATRYRQHAEEYRVVVERVKAEQK